MTPFNRRALSLLISTLCFTLPALSEILRWPQLCPSGKLTIQNTSNRTYRAWIQNFSDGKRIETELALPARSQTSVDVKSRRPMDRFTLMHFENPAKISAVYECEKTPLRVKAHSVEGGVMNFLKSDLAENKLWIQNLYSDFNQVQIEYLNADHKVVFSESLRLGALEQKNHKPVLPGLEFSYISISAKNRFTAFNLTSLGATGPFSVRAQNSELETKATYFLVGPREGEGDTFIVQIKDAEMILRARELVTHPELEKMVFAKIEKGHRNYNRNWSKKEKSFWSWAPTEVTNFADYGSTACNGIPQLLEDEIDQWVENPGIICFWNYRIKKELRSSEVAAP